MLYQNALEKRFSFFNTNYELLVNYYTNKNSKKIFLGNKREKCRFCGKKYPEVTFKKIAHSLPEFIGNKKIFSYYECDTCNDEFGKNIENHFSNYLSALRTISLIKGKEKIPIYKTKDKLTRIDIKNGQLTITTTVGNPAILFDDNKKILKLNLDKAPYIPVAVYKALCKIALSIMPEEEVDNFKLTFKWIAEKKHKNCYTSNSLKSFLGFTPGFLNDFVYAGLFKKKNFKENTPYMIFALAFYNYFFQIHVPLCEKDKNLTGTTNLYPTPLIFDLYNKYGKPIYQVIDLSSESMKREEQFFINISFDSTYKVF